MGKLAIGDVIAVPFPFSDLSRAKKRPALVVASAEHGDVILCQITSRSYASKRVLPIGSADFVRGALPMDSFARPDKLFTASESIAVGVLGSLTESRLRDIRQSISALFQD
jgi:mRNA interferase MazF